MIHLKRGNQPISPLIIFDLYGNDSKSFKYGEDQNGDDTERSQILHHNKEERFSFEFSGTFHLVDNNSWFRDICNKDTSQESRDRHEHTVAQEVKEIQDRESNDLYSA